MKRHYTNNKSNISVCRFMELCGLQCDFKKTVRISHEIMLKKLGARYELFPNMIVLPQKISFNSYSNEDVLNGKVVEVEDDYKRVIAYKNPTYLKASKLLQTLNATADKNELEKIRKCLLKTQGYSVCKNGEIIKKEKETPVEIEFQVTAKLNRARRFINKGGRNSYAKK